jgi:hypothetical protein
MKRIKILVLALMTVGVAVFAVAPSALASGPTLLFLSGEPGPTVLFNLEKKTYRGELQSRLANIKSSEVELEVTLLQGSSGAKGIYLVKFFRAFLEGGTEPKCRYPSSAREGEISILPTRSELAELVYDTLTPTLGVAILFLVGTRETVTIECGTLRLRTKGTVLGLLMRLGTQYSAGENRIEGRVACSRTFGVAAEKTFWNFEGREGTAKLEVTSGGETEEACESVEENTVVKLLATRMIELDG